MEQRGSFHIGVIKPKQHDFVILVAALTLNFQTSYVMFI